MSGSFPVFDTVVEHLVSAVAPARALDIGAGAGKVGRLLKRVHPACHVTAIEANVRHVTDFALQDLYDRVLPLDATQWWRQEPDERFDLVVAADCLQHLPKSAGLDLLNAMVYRCAWLLVLVPEFVVQGTIAGADTSVHRSVWSERDLHWHDLWAWDNARAVSMLLLRGYQPSPLDIDTVVTRVNDCRAPLLDFDGHTAVRPCHLRLVDYRRETVYRPR